MDNNEKVYLSEDLIKDLPINYSFINNLIGESILRSIGIYKRDIIEIRRDDDTIYIDYSDDDDIITRKIQIDEIVGKDNVIEIVVSESDANYRYQVDAKDAITIYQYLKTLDKQEKVVTQKLHETSMKNFHHSQICNPLCIL